MNHRGLYNITNVNTRVQKAGEEDGDLAVDIDFKNTVHRGALLEVFNEHQLDALIAGLYDENGRQINVGVKRIQLDNEFDGTVRISIGLRNWAVLSSAKIKKFSLAPNGAGTFELKGQIQAVPSDGDLEALCHLQKTDTEIDFDVAPFVGSKSEETDDSQSSMPLGEAA